MAASVVSAGNGLGILALAPLTRWLITEYDWRMAFLVLGNLAWAIAVPCALLLRVPPEAQDQRPTSNPGTGCPQPGGVRGPFRGPRR